MLLTKDILSKGAIAPPGDLLLINSRKWDPSTVDLVDRMNPEPDYDRKKLINTLIKGLKSVGSWDRFDCLWVLAGFSQQSARLNWIKDLHNLIEVNAPDFLIDRGYKSDGATSYIESGYTPSLNAVKLGLNSVSIGAYILENVMNPIDIGFYDDLDTLDLFHINSRNSGNDFKLGVHVPQPENIPNILSDTGTSIGFFQASRYTSSDCIFRTGWASGSFTQNGLDHLAEMELYILVLNRASGILAGHLSTRRSGLFYVGGSLTADQQEGTETVVEAYMDAIGAGILS